MDRVVPGWSPLGDAAPTNDDQVFELLTAAVFQARFRPEIVRARWPSIRAAFADFHLPVVATWSDEKTDELLLSPGMIRNPKKIRAALRNARDLEARSKRFGGSLAYFDLFSDEDALVREIDDWAHYIGAPSIRWFVRSLRRCRDAPDGQNPGGFA